MVNKAVRNSQKPPAIIICDENAPVFNWKLVGKAHEVYTQAAQKGPTV